MNFRSIAHLFMLVSLAVPLLLAASPAAAQQKCLIGEVKMFAGNFAPGNWHLAEGQILAIASNDTLFSILGTSFGGDGRTTFALPDLRGRVPVGTGSGPGLGLDPRLGSKGGAENVTLNVNQIPSHTHALVATDDPASETTPDDTLPAAKTRTKLYADPDEPNQNRVTLAPEAVAPAGGGASHPNHQPYLGINFIICHTGDYPSR